jgi:N-methylhydantoinase A/oxoprolinase/acetone carboxylase beta subunit
MRRVYVPVWHAFEQVAVYSGEDVGEEDMISGPAIIEMSHTTVVVPPIFRLHCDAGGSFLLRRFAVSNK